MNLASIRESRASKVATMRNLLTTAEGDSRVDPMHARKMAALLQAHPGAELALLRVDRDAGHGVGKPLAKQVDDLADQWAFLAWRLGGTVEA